MEDERKCRHELAVFREVLNDQAFLAAAQLFYFKARQPLIKQTLRFVLEPEIRQFLFADTGGEIAQAHAVDGGENGIHPIPCKEIRPAIFEFPLFDVIGINKQLKPLDQAIISHFSQRAVELVVEPAGLRATQNGDADIFRHHRAAPDAVGDVAAEAVPAFKEKCAVTRAAFLFPRK